VGSAHPTPKKKQLKENAFIKLPLMADNGQSDVELLNTNTSIWHDGVVEANIAPIYSLNSGTSQVGMKQSTITKYGTSEIVSQYSLGDCSSDDPNPSPQR
jgi:hypothetical protein